MPSEGGGASGAFINLRVFRRENHFLHPLGECPPSARGDRLRTYSNAPCILHGSPHGVARNNHRRLLRGHGSNLHALRSRYISSPFGSPRKLPSLLFIFFILPAGESRFKNWSRNRYLVSIHRTRRSLSLSLALFLINLPIWAPLVGVQTSEKGRRRRGLVIFVESGVAGWKFEKFRNNIPTVLKEIRDRNVRPGWVRGWRVYTRLFLMLPPSVATGRRRERARVYNRYRCYRN